jgi:sec-independent protein translocase protein TatA
MFGLEPWHVVLVLAVALIVFGPKRLPEIGRGMGQSIREFRKATSELGDSVRAGTAEPEPTATQAPLPPTSSAEHGPGVPSASDRSRQDGA